MSTSTFSYAIYAVIAASWVAWGVFTQVERPRYATLGSIVRGMMRHPLILTFRVEDDALLFPAHAVSPRSCATSCEFGRFVPSRARFPSENGRAAR